MSAAPESNISTDALWFLTRQYTSHMVKRRGAGVPTLSTEAGNLKGVHSYKYSGLIHPKIFTVSPNANGKGVSIISRRSKGGKSQVKGAANRRNLKAGSGPRRTNKIVDGAVKNYRPDLRVAAVKRASRILESQRVHKPLQQRKPRGARRSKAALEVEA